MIDAANTYEAKATEFLKVRDISTIGASVVDCWARSLPCSATVLELGCGGGKPITEVLCSRHLSVWAIDSSPTLVREFQSRFPAIPTQCANVQESNFFNQRYDAAIAIGLIFLLPKQDQLNFISKVANSLHSGGRFLFTAPIEKSNWVDINTGMECRSLGQNVYESQLRNSGLRAISSYKDSGNNNYYDTERIC